MMQEPLAIDGGIPVRTAPWRESNAINEEEKQAVLRVMERGRLSVFQGAWKPMPPYDFLGGPEVQALEALAKEMIGVRHVVAVNSATSGLTAAAGALGLGFGDEVIVSPYTMSACAMAPLWYGAIPVFADVTVEGSLDPASVRERITPRTKAILVVHQFGIPAEMEQIMAIAHEHKLRVIEDCAQAWGATYQNKSVGTIGDIGVYSFNVHKTIQCGEGGLCVTNDDELALRIRLIRNHGEAVVEDAGYAEITNIVGCNFRMTELQAAVAQEQMKKLPELNARRIRLVEALSAGLQRNKFLSVPSLKGHKKATYYVYPLRYHAECLRNMPRKEFMRTLAAEGISFSEGYQKPLYLLPLFQKRAAFRHGYPWSALENRSSHPSYAEGTCPTAERLYRQELLLNMYICPPQLERDMEDIVAAVDKIARVHC